MYVLLDHSRVSSVGRALDCRAEGMGSIPGAKAILRVLNPLSPKIQMQILQTDLHTFALRIVERIWFKIKSFSVW